MSDQLDIFPGYTSAKAKAERQAREWSSPAEDTAPEPRWRNEDGRDVEPGHSPALPECWHTCPWRKPLRVRHAERVLARKGHHPSPHHDECHHPFWRETEVVSSETCWPTLAAMQVGAPEGEGA